MFVLSPNFSDDLPVEGESPVDSAGCTRDAGGHVIVRGIFHNGSFGRWAGILFLPGYVPI